MSRFNELHDITTQLEDTNRAARREQLWHRGDAPRYAGVWSTEEQPSAREAARDAYELGEN